MVGVGFEWNMQMEMIEEEIETDVVAADTEIETEITVDVAGKCLMGNSEELIIDWWWKIFPQGRLGRT